MNSVHTVTLNDFESSGVEDPRLPKLVLSVVGDEAFLSIVDQRDTNKVRHAEVLAEVGVNLDDLQGALALLDDRRA